MDMIKGVNLIQTLCSQDLPTIYRFQYVYIALYALQMHQNSTLFLLFYIFKVGLAGNLRNFVLICHGGEMVS